MNTKQKNIEEIKKQEKAIFKFINEIAIMRKIDPKLIVETFKDVVIKTIEKKIDPDADIQIDIDLEKKEIKAVNNATWVVSDEEALTQDEKLNDIFSIGITEAKTIDPEVEEYGEVRKEFSINSLNSEIKKTIMQVFRQKIIEIIRNSIFEKYQNRQGEVVKAKFVSKTKSGFLFELEEDSTMAYMPSKISNNRIKLELNQVIDVYIDEVRNEVKEAQIILSNASEQLIKKSLYTNIPEIASGEVEIVRISRLPGERAKVAVQLSETAETNIEEIGAIVGAGGSRIKAVSEALNGEKIDIVKYSTDINKFISEAMSPAKVVGVKELNPLKGKRKFLVIVPDIHKTLAIGKLGINILLAVELTKVNIDIISLSEAKEKNIIFEWNGNINSEDVDKLESGVKLGYKKDGFGTNKGKRSTRSNFLSNIDMTDLDQDIADYHFNLEDREFEIDNTLSMEEVQEMMAQKTDNTIEEISKEFKNNKNIHTDYKIDKDLSEFAGIDGIDFDEDDTW